MPLSFLLSVSQSVVESTAQAETVDRPVNIAMTGAAATSGSLEWNSIASAHSYVYRHKRSSLTSWQDQVEIGTATATVSGLNSVAQYDSRSGRRTMNEKRLGVDWVGYNRSSGADGTNRRIRDSQRRHSRMGPSRRCGRILLPVPSKKERRSGRLIALGAVSTANWWHLTADTRYEFRVLAYSPRPDDSVVQGEFSSVVEGATFPVPPTLDVPSGLQANSSGSAGKHLIWDKVTDALSYEYRYKENSSASWGVPAEVSDSEAVVMGPSGDTQYDFQVRATNVGVESDWSAAIQVTTKLDCPAGLTFSPLL